MNRWQQISLISIALLSISSCSPPPGKSAKDVASKGEGEIIVGTTKKPVSLDPADAYDLASISLIRNLSDRLYTYDPGSTELKPQLATALPTVSQDGLIYTIPLRQGVIFHDNTPFNAQAMAFSLQRFIDNKGKPSSLLSERVATIETNGDYEIKITLKKPFAAFPSLLAFPGTCAVSPQAYAKNKENKSEFKPNSFVGTGPYKLNKYSDYNVKLDAFDRYWGKKPLNQNVTVQIFQSNPANLYNSFRTGAIDVAYSGLEPDQVKILETGAKTGNWQSIAVDGSETSYLILNVLQEPLDNPLVRQALAALIDRRTINERVLYGQGKPLYSIIPDTFSVSQPVFKTANGDNDIPKVKQLLTQAGFTPQHPAKIPLWFASGSSSSRITASFLRAYAKKRSGGLLEIEPNTIERASFFRNTGLGVYPATLQSWYPDFLDPDNFIQPFLECPKPAAQTVRKQAKPGCKEGGSQSQGLFYFDEGMNQSIVDQGKERDPVKRQQIYANIQAQIRRDVPLIPLWQTKNFIFAQKGTSGVKVDPLQNLLYSEMKK
jgi:peptide/nickel transport system substrate-binding protein